MYNYTDMTVDIHKAVGIIIEGRKVLVVRANDDENFISLGGKLEAGETAIEALHRECKEEVAIDIDVDSTEKLETYYGTAFGKHAGKSIQIDAFIINNYTGTIAKSSEIVELAWVDSLSYTKYGLPPIFLNKIIPTLLKQGLID